MAEAATISMGGALTSRTSVEWWTPPHIFEALGLDFDLDPCAPPEPAAPWLPVERRYTKTDDGLLLPWHRHDRVWLNPPYGREAADWVAKLIDHGDGVALVFTRTCARWGQAALAAADAVCFIAGRIQFVDGTGQGRKDNAANSSMLLAYGPECARAVLDCGLGVSFTQPQEMVLGPAPCDRCGENVENLELLGREALCSPCRAALTQPISDNKSGEG